jgi:diguanylate cyclase (GGDEF)-like protein
MEARESQAGHQTTEQLMTELLGMIERCQREMVELNREEVYTNCLSALAARTAAGPAILLLPDETGTLKLKLATDSLPFSADLLTLDPSDFDRTGELPKSTRDEMIASGVRNLISGVSGGKDVFCEVLAEQDTLDGVLLLLSAGQNRFGQTDIENLRQVANSIQLVLRTAGQFQTLLGRVSIDTNTGLFNQRYFMPRLQAELSRASRHGHPFGLLFFDLDEFKNCNDAWGYGTANELLHRVADLLRSADQVPGARFCFRRSDVPIRHRGDEFAVLLPETPKWGALTKAERLRKAIEALPTPAGGPNKLTASIGVAAFPEDSSDAKSLVEAAVGAMARAKSNGRNRVEGA